MVGGCMYTPYSTYFGSDRNGCWLGSPLPLAAGLAFASCSVRISTSISIFPWRKVSCSKQWVHTPTLHCTDITEYNNYMRLTHNYYRYTVVRKCCEVNGGGEKDTCIADTSRSHTVDMYTHLH